MSVKRGGRGPGHMVRVSRLQPVDVVMQIGDSNVSGSGDALTDLPTGYYSTDANAFIWDAAGFSGSTNVITPLVPGPMEQQPEGNPATSVVVGGCGEFVKHYRTANPASSVYFFVFQEANGRFTDASARVRAANFDPQFTDGAYANLKTRWNAFVAALAAQGKTPNRIGCRISMGANPAFDNTETTNFQANMETWIAAMIADGILTGSTKLIFERVSLNQTGLTVANLPAIKTATQNLVLADTAHRELMSADGYKCGADNIHWTSASFVSLGENLYYHCANLWYPQKEQTFLGGNPVTHEYRFGDLRNTAGATAFTTTGGNLQTAWDCSAGAGGIAPTQATDANRPVISVTNTPNGYGARYATSDGVNDILSSTTTFLKTGTNCAFAALSSTASASIKVICGESNSASVTQLLEIISSDGSTGANEAFFVRNDASVLAGPSSIATSAFNGTMNFIAVTDTGATATGYVNGTVGTPLSYTRGTITTDRFTIFGMLQNSVNGFNMAAKVGILWFTAVVPDATYRANAQAYAQRRWGTV